MSRPIHDKDPHFEHTRSAVAEQQAARLLRAQTVTQQPPFQDSALTTPRPSEIQEISREGLIGSRRLAADLEGMLRDKPKFTTFTSTDGGPTVGSDGSDGSASPAQGVAQFSSFLPGEQPSDLLDPNPRPTPPSQDENSQDLNLSHENRQQALNQGVPRSVTGRMAMDMFRRPSSDPAPDSSTASSPPAGDAGSAAPASTDSAAGATVAAPEGVDPLLSRASTNFDRSQVSTAADSLGETRGVTDNELVLHRDDPGQAQNSIGQELSRQSSAQDESSRRADHAQSTLDTLGGRERDLNVQRGQLDSAKAGQRSNADETQRVVEADNQRLERNSAGVQQVQRAGEASLARINSLDSQVDQNAQARDQAGSDLQASEQSAQGLQSQVDSLQRQTPKAPSSPPGNSEKSQGKGAENGKSEQAAQQAAAAAQSQQAITSAQAQLAQVQKAQEDAKKRQQQAEASLQANQAAAAQERQNLDQLRGQLDQGVQARGSSQSVAQGHKAQLQQDLDRVKDLGGHTQDINTQFDDIGDAKRRAQGSLQSNRANASAAKQNVEQLRSLSADGAFQDGAKSHSSNAAGDSGQPTVNDHRPSVTVSTGESGGVETTGASSPGAAAPTGAAQRGPGPSVQDQGEKVVVRLQSLNQGNNSSMTDTSSGASKRRSGTDGGGDDLGAASLAAAAAASSPSSSSVAQASSSESFRDSGPGKSGEEHGNSDHGNAGGNGNGKGHKG